ncbi:MAG: hypothetical protein M1833_005181 [Piccolia ochrophora]|nr:MAG: hypothetical protein M1833_005181 [Piccolia ochrophora]
MDPDLPPTSSPSSSPGAFRYILGYLLVSLAWGFTTPFIRRAAVTHKPRPPPEFLTHKTSHRTISSSSSSSEEDTSRADGGGGNGNGSGTGSGAGKRPRALPVRYVLSKAWNVYDLVRDWRYALPLACNLLGSVGFFALVGRSGGFSFSFLLWGFV